MREKKTVCARMRVCVYVEKKVKAVTRTARKREGRSERAERWWLTGSLAKLTASL